MLKFSGEAARNVFNKVGFAVAGLFQSQFSGFGEFSVHFSKEVLEINPCFCDRRKMIP